MRVVTDPAEKRHGLDVLLEHLESDPGPVRERALPDDASYDRCEVLRLDVEEITAKQALAKPTDEGAAG